MKKQTSISTIFFAFCVTACVTTGSDDKSSSAKNCESIRAAFDIGSGSTKMQVARVDHCLGRTIEALVDGRRPVPVKSSLSRSSDNRIPAATISIAQNALTELKEIALKAGAQEFSAVATASFRRAHNGAEALRQLSATTGISIHLIDQKTEAKLGYNSVADKLGNKSDFIVWDIGAGSMQMSTKIQGKLSFFFGQLASVSFRDLIISKVQKKTPQTETPNPISSRQQSEALRLAVNHASKHLPPPMRQIKKRLIGIGDLHKYSILGQLKGNKTTFSVEELTALVKSNLNKADHEFASKKYANTEASNVLLVLGYMKAMSAKEVKVISVNLTDGLLVSNSYWAM